MVRGVAVAVGPVQDLTFGSNEVLYIRMGWGDHEGNQNDALSAKINNHLKQSKI
jgi:hypothetical protein